MKAAAIYAGLANGEFTPEKLAAMAQKEPAALPALVDGMEQTKADVKYGCAKALRIVVDDAPELLYEYFDRFADLLEHPKNIFQWQALYLLAGLACIDEEHKIEAVWKRYFARLEGPVMVTAANAIKGGAVMAKGRPELALRIMKEALRAERGRYETDECYEIVCGEALKAFYKIRKFIPDFSPMLEFAQRHQDSPRPSTRAAAGKLLARAKAARPSRQKAHH